MAANGVWLVRVLVQSLTTSGQNTSANVVDTNRL